jgi:hypothetical protein
LARGTTQFYKREKMFRAAPSLCQLSTYEISYSTTRVNILRLKNSIVLIKAFSQVASAAGRLQVCHPASNRRASDIYFLFKKKKNSVYHCNNFGIRTVNDCHDEGTLMISEFVCSLLNEENNRIAE